MKFALILLCLCFLTLTFACSKSKKSIAGSGNIVTQTRNVKSFEQIMFSGNGNLFISQGEEESVRIEGEDNIIDLIQTLVVDKTLRIDYKKSSLATLINSKQPINVYVQVNSIQEIRLAGTGNIITAKPLKAHSLKLSIGGSGNAKIEVVGHKLVSILSGSGRFEISGMAENQDIWISGTGVYQGFGLTSNVANVNITGSGQVYVNVQDDMDVRISGAGTVIYKGNPRVRQSISGTGKIEPASDENTKL